MERKKKDQEQMEGDDFQLREAFGNNYRIPLTATQDGRTKTYHVTLSSSSGSGRTLSDALHDLANQCSAKKLYGSELYDPQLLVGKNLRCCQWCEAPIFFAMTPNQRWMPVDGEQILASHLSAQEYGARAFVIVDEGGKPHVRSVRNADGAVWIAHPDVCGVKEEPPEAPALWDRWRKNRTVTESRQNETVGDLQDMVANLEKG